MDDLISRQAAIEAVCKAGCGSGFCGVECDEVLALKNTPSAQLDTPTNTPTDCISRQAAIDALFELYEYQRDIDPTEAADLVRQGIYLAEKKIEQLPSVQPDLSVYSDKLWKAAYERGKADAQPDIIHCGECKYYDDSDGCFFSTATTGADGFCHWAERKEGEADEGD